jgi:hypothetical protein
MPTINGTVALTVLASIKVRTGIFFFFWQYFLKGEQLVAHMLEEFLLQAP